MQNRNHMHTNWWRLRQKRCRDVTWRVQKHILVTYPWSVVGVDEILHYYNTRQSVIKLNWKIRIRTVDCSRTEWHHAPKLWITSKRGTVWIVMQLFAHLRCVNCSFHFLCWCANIFQFSFHKVNCHSYGALMMSHYHYVRVSVYQSDTKAFSANF